MKLINLIGFALTVAGTSIPAGTHRAVAPQISTAPEAELVEFEELGELPVIEPGEIAISDCTLEPGGLAFPGPEEDTIFLAPIPVRLAALRAGRTDVWGMGDRVDPRDPNAGVKNLAR